MTDWLNDWLFVCVFCLSVCLSVCLSNWRLTDWLTDRQTSAALVTDCRLPNWLNDCGKITHWLSDWRSLIEWLTERLSVCLSDWWISDWSRTDWLPSYRWMSYLWLMIYSVLSDWLTDSLTAWLTDWLNDRPTGWPTGQLADRLTDWQTDWLTDWLTDWPTDWLTVTVNLYCALLSKRGIGLFTIKVVYNVDYWLTVGSLTLVLWSSIPPHTYRVILSPPLVIPSRKWWCSSVSRVPTRVLSYRHLFPQSRNPEGYFWHPVSLALIFNPESRPSNEANLETRRTYWGL